MEGVRNNADGRIKVGAVECTPSVSEVAWKPEFLGIKLRKGVLLGRRRGASTPAPSWKMEPKDQGGVCVNDERGERVSARKLGATLWGIHRIYASTPPSHSGRKKRKGVRKIKQRRDKGIEFDHQLGDPWHNSAEKQIYPPIGGNLRKQVAGSMIQLDKHVDRDNHAVRSFSPASSTEITPYDHVGTPCNSSENKGKSGDLDHNLKTSTELLRVLNRIWILEEQHASNTSLIKALKLERYHARSRMNALIQMHQSDRSEIDNLVKQLTVLMKKHTVHESIEEELQTVREELEDEERLRRKSENLHQKLAKELDDVKLALSKSVKELESEGRARLLLEDLCDQFARGIKDYEQELHGLKQKYVKAHSNRVDGLILRIAEAWLDERDQMTLAEGKCNPQQNNTIIARLQREIASFLQTKQSNNSKFGVHFKDDSNDDFLRRHSLESFPLNEAAGSGPQLTGEEDSTTNDLHSFSVNKNGGQVEKSQRTNTGGRKAIADLEARFMRSCSKAKVGSQRLKVQSSFQGQRGGKRYSSILQGRKLFTERKIVSHTDNNHEDEVGKKSEIEICIDKKSGKREAQDGVHIGDMDRARDQPLRSQALILGDRACSKIEHKENFDSSKVILEHGSTEETFGGIEEVSSPKKKWNCNQNTTELEVKESSMKLPENVKKNSLEAKLLEARLEG